MKRLVPALCIVVIACGGAGSSSDDSSDASDTSADSADTDGSESGDGGDDPDVLFNSLVQELAVLGSDVYLAGPFDDVGGDDSLDYFVKWDGENVVTPGEGAPPYVQRLMVYDGDLYTCIGPNSVTGDHSHFLSRFDGNAWTHLAPYAGDDDLLIDCIISPSGDIHLAGTFTLSDALPHAGVVKWDGNDLVPVGAEITDVAQVRVADGGTTYVVRAGANVEYGDIQRLSGGAWEPLPALPDGATWRTHPWINTVGNALHAAAPTENANGDDQTVDFYSWDGSNWQAHAGDQAFEFDFPHATYRVIDGEYYSSRYGIWAKWSDGTWVEVTPTARFRNTEDAWQSQVDVGLAIDVEDGAVYVAGFYPYR